MVRVRLECTVVCAGCAPGDNGRRTNASNCVGTTPTCRRTADHYVEFAETAGPHLRSRDQREWNDRVTRDIDNLRAVLDWAVDTPSPEHALRLIAPMTVSGMTVGYAAMDWAEIAGAIPHAHDHPLYVVIASWAAWGATMRVDLERADALITAAQEGERTLNTGHPHVERAPAVAAYFRGDIEQAQVHAYAYVELARAAADRYELAESLVLLSAAQQPTDPETAIATLAKSSSSTVSTALGGSALTNEHVEGQTSATIDLLDRDAQRT